MTIINSNSKHNMRNMLPYFQVKFKEDTEKHSGCCPNKNLANAFFQELPQLCSRKHSLAYTPKQISQRLVPQHHVARMKRKHKRK